MPGEMGEALKYYIYISDAKVDMLFPQTPQRNRRKVVEEFGFDLKLLNAKRRVEKENTDNRISRLQTVVSAIRAEKRVGSIDAPGTYFEGTIQMRMVILDGLTFWSARTPQVIVGLGGSICHLLGHYDPLLYRRRPSSFLGAILDPLKKEIMRLEGPKKASRRLASERSGLDLLRDLTILQNNPTQEFEFLAKRLIAYPKDGRGPENGLLGTPLYVAKSD